MHRLLADIVDMEEEAALRVVLGLVILMRSKLRDVRKAAVGAVTAIVLPFSSSSSSSSSSAAAKADKLEVLLTALAKDKELIIESEDAVKRVFATLNETKKQRWELEITQCHNTL